ncbi:hypothetical protein [Streptomyces agglomeratus]|uniref:hypothetical protein n=1 Tax=Streptomyces agglomeratus TaxID=285458 RepID=UPI00114CB318|nr:hypothetical protein [Streptomyces agglomeratus]
MPRILANPGSVGLNMTKVSRLVSAGQRLTGAKSAAPCIRMGEWVFTPAVSHRLKASNATLHDKDRHVDLWYSASLLEDLLARLDSIEADFSTTSTTTDVTPSGQPKRPLLE